MLVGLLRLIVAIFDDFLLFFRRRYARLSVGLITLGSNLSSMGRFVSQLEEEIADSEIGKLVVLNSGDGPNLKTALKHIIRATVTEDKDGNEITLKEYLAHTSVGCFSIAYYALVRN